MFGGGGAGRLGGGVPYLVVLRETRRLVGGVLDLESITWTPLGIRYSPISPLNLGFVGGGNEGGGGLTGITLFLGSERVRCLWITAAGLFLEWSCKFSMLAYSNCITH